MAFPGACTSLQNLVFDQSNPEQVVARPGVGSALTAFASLSAAGAVSIHIAIGNTIYGMIKSTLNAGFDQPFAYNLTAGFIAISGITAANVPTTQAVTGDWTPPTMAVIGPNIIVTHPGFSGANFFGTLNIANPLAPTWVAGNTATNALPSVPVAVANYNNRAYYACGNLAYYSDSLVPGTMTNAGQALTLGDTTPITGFSGLPIQTTTAGVVAALVAFKASQIWQITGDAAITNTLAENYLSLTVGCASPRTIVATPIGIIFIGVDSPYIITQTGILMPLVNGMQRLQSDLHIPFQNIVNPGRAAAAYSGNIYRVCLDTVVKSSTVTNDYWFDTTARRWNGPHTWPFDCASQVGNYFVLSHRTKAVGLFQSQYMPQSTSVYDDNGTAISVKLESSFLPKMQNINVKEVIESTIELSYGGSSLSYQINALSESLAISGTSTLQYAGAPLRRWGDGSKWGDGGLWNAATPLPVTETVPWSTPVIFKKLALQILAQASYFMSIGTFFAKYKNTGYTNVR